MAVLRRANELSCSDDNEVEHERWMRLAMAEAELARGGTGDNPWVGCAIVSAAGELLGRGHTRGPGEIGAAGGATARRGPPFVPR